MLELEAATVGVAVDHPLYDDVAAPVDHVIETALGKPEVEGADVPAL